LTCFSSVVAAVAAVAVVVLTAVVVVAEVEVSFKTPFISPRVHTPWMLVLVVHQVETQVKVVEAMRP